MDYPTTATVGPLALLCLIQLLWAYSLWVQFGQRLQAGLLIGLVLGTLATVRYWKEQVAATVILNVLVILGGLILSFKDLVTWAHRGGRW
jgi:hypothetical protein